MNNLKDFVTPELYQYLKISERLNKVELEYDGFDLNPQLTIMKIAHEIATDVKKEVPCYVEDVLLVWLTNAVHYHKWLAKNSPAVKLPEK